MDAQNGITLYIQSGIIPFRRKDDQIEVLLITNKKKDKWGIPKGLVEAARMDGASHWRALWEIVCPMTKSSFITFGLMNFISTYNNYMLPTRLSFL